MGLRNHHRPFLKNQIFGDYHGYATSGEQCFFFYGKNNCSSFNSENYLDFILAAPPCEKVIIVPDTNYIISAIKKFMLDMPSPGSLQNIGILNMSTTGLRACETMWFKLGKNSRSSIENQLAQFDSSLNADQKW